MVAAAACGPQADAAITSARCRLCTRKLDIRRSVRSRLVAASRQTNWVSTMMLFELASAAHPQAAYAHSIIRRRSASGSLVVPKQPFMIHVVEPFQWPTVAIPIAKRLPVGGIDLPSAIGIGLENVPVMTPVTAVHVPEPKRMGCSLISIWGQRRKAPLNPQCAWQFLWSRDHPATSQRCLQNGSRATDPFLVAEHIKIQSVEDL